MVGALGMTDSLVSFMAMEEGLNERKVVAKVLADPDGRARTHRLLKEAKLGRPGRDPAGPERPQPPHPPSGPARSAGRSGPGRVGSPRR